VLARLARPADLEPALEVWRRANTAQGKTPDQHRIARIRAKLTDPAALVIVAMADGDVVGVALAEPGRDQDGAGQSLPELCHISMVFVHPDRWGERIGEHCSTRSPNTPSTMATTACNCGPASTITAPNASIDASDSCPTAAPSN
jgi:predicted N-acetyltransferase YhbS